MVAAHSPPPSSSPRSARALPHHHSGRHLRDTPRWRPDRRRTPVTSRRRHAGPGAERTVRPTCPEVADLPDPDGVPLHILVGMRWLTYLMAVNTFAGRTSPASRPLRLSPGGGSLASWLVFVSPPGTHGHLDPRRADPLAWSRARHLPALGQSPLEAVAGRTDPGPFRCHQPRQRAVGSVLRPGAGCEDRQRRPSALPASGHWTAVLGQRLQHRTGSGPLRLVDRRRLRPHRRHPCRCRRTVGSRSTLMPGTSIGAGAHVEPGSAVLGKVKAGHLVAGSPAERRGKAKNGWPETPSSHAPDRPALVCGVRCRLGAACPDPLPLGIRRGDRRPGLHPRQDFAAGCLPGTPACHSLGGTGLVPVQSPPDPGDHPDARRRAQGGVLPGPQPRRLAGLGHRTCAGHGAGPALPHLRQPLHPRMVAHAGRQSRPQRRGLHGAAAADA